MKHCESIRVPVGELQQSEFRDFLGLIDEEDVLALKEDSFDRYNDFWMGLRVYRKGDKYHLLFGHRRIRAFILKEGPDKLVSARVVEVTDEEKILFLGEAGWKNATDGERFGLVKLAAAFLIEYGEGTSAQVDIDLLKERVGNGWQNVGAQRISNWLGKRLWPRPRIWELLDAGKRLLAQQKEIAADNPPREHEIQSAVEPVHSEGTPGYTSLEGDPNAPVNPAAVFKGEFPKEGAVIDVEAYRKEFGTVAEPAVAAPVRVREQRILQPGELYDRILTTRQNGIQKDFERLTVQDLKRRFKTELIEFISELHA